MNWVTDLDALRTIVALRCFQEGDEVMERNVKTGKEMVTKFEGPDLWMEGFYNAYANSHVSKWKSEWHLVAWRRP
jgi:hypothetical protein